MERLFNKFGVWIAAGTVVVLMMFNIRFGLSAKSTLDFRVAEVQSLARGEDDDDWSYDLVEEWVWCHTGGSAKIPISWFSCEWIYLSQQNLCFTKNVNSVS